MKQNCSMIIYNKTYYILSTTNTVIMINISEENNQKWQQIFDNDPQEQRISKFNSDETSSVTPSSKGNSEGENLPWSSIGLLTFTMGIQKRNGTASLIGHNVIITSAFNCYDLSQQTQATNIIFTPSYNLGKKKEQFKAKSIHYPKEFQSITSEYDKNDANIKKYGYAMIELDCQRDLQETYGSLGYAFFSIQEDDVSLSLKGYGSNQENQIILQSYEIKSSEQVAKLSNMEMQMNGAPIIACSQGIYHQGCQALKLKKQMYQNLQNWLFSSNYKITKHSYQIDPEGCKWLVQKEIANLNELSLCNISVMGNEGCEWLSQGKWPHLNKLQLNDNRISAQGCEWIVKGDWKELHTIKLDSNGFGDEGCLKLSQSKWPNLRTLHLYGNYIGNKGCEGLSKSNWPLLSILQLRNNSIGGQGCEWLSKADWKNLYSLDLQLNQVGAQGCKWLSQANWRALRNLNLEENGVGDEGCFWLVKARWQQLAAIVLVGNGVTNNGAKSLATGNWSKLRHLDLNSNSVTAEGCKWLSKGEWPELKLLSFWNNGINQQEEIRSMLQSRFQNLKNLQF